MRIESFARLRFIRAVHSVLVCIHLTEDTGKKVSDSQAWVIPNIIITLQVTVYPFLFLCGVAYLSHISINMSGNELDVNVDPQQADCLMLDEQCKKWGPGQGNLGQGNTSQETIFGMIKTMQGTIWWPWHNLFACYKSSRLTEAQMNVKATQIHASWL